MHMSQNLFNMTTALHISDITITHLQEHKINVTSASGNRYTVIDIVKFNCIYYSVTVTRCCNYSYFVLLKMGDSDARNM
jgi:hypothetical protein